MTTYGKDRDRPNPSQPTRCSGASTNCFPASACPAQLLSEPSEAGEQTLVPGVRPTSLRERLQLKAEAPLAPTRLQRPLDIGLFDLAARAQLDLF